MGRICFHYLKLNRGFYRSLLPLFKEFNWNERFTITEYDADAARGYNWTFLCDFNWDKHCNSYGRYPLFRILINPLLVISQTIPIVVLAPLFIIWFGYGMLPKVMVVILVCFFPIALSILEGFQTVDKNMLELLQTMKATNGKFT